MQKRTRSIVMAGAAAALIAAAIWIGSAAGPPRATASDEALEAARQIAAGRGGGEQPKNADGVPLDAVVPAGVTPGTFSTSGPAGD